MGHEIEHASKYVDMYVYVYTYSSRSLSCLYEACDTKNNRVRDCFVANLQ